MIGCPQLCWLSVTLSKQKNVVICSTQVLEGIMRLEGWKGVLLCNLALFLFHHIIYYEDYVYILFKITSSIVKFCS